MHKMNPSFHLLCTRLKIPSQDIQWQGKQNPKLSVFRHLDRGTLCLEKGVLYIGLTGDISPQIVFNEGCAILLVENKPMAGPCPIPHVIFPNTTSLYSLANRVFSIFEELRSWGEDLASELIHGGNIQTMLDMSVKIFDNVLYVADASFKILAFTDIPLMRQISVPWKFMADHGYLSLDIVIAMNRYKELSQMGKAKRAILFTSKMFTNPFIYFNIYIDGVFRCRLILVKMLHDLVEADLELIEYLGHFITWAMTGDKRYTIIPSHIHEHFFIDILEGRIKDTLLIKDQLKHLNWETEGFFCILIIPQPKENREIIKVLAYRLEYQYDAKTVYHNGKVVAIFSLKNWNSLHGLEEKMRLFLKETEQKGGISESFFGFEKLPDYYSQASCAYAMGVEEDEEKNLYIYHHYLNKHILSTAQKGINLYTLCHKALFRLQEYDRKNNSELFDTLDVYLRNERSLVKSAKALYIHRNTLVNRIERITEILKIDLNQYETRQWLQTSYRIFHYLSSQERHNNRSEH